MVLDEINVSLRIGQTKSPEIIPAGEIITIDLDESSPFEGFIIINHNENRRFLSEKSLNNLAPISIESNNLLGGIKKTGTLLLDFDIPSVNVELIRELNHANSSIKKKLRETIIRDVFLEDYLGRILTRCIEDGNFQFETTPKIYLVQNDDFFLFSMNDGSIYMSLGFLTELDNEQQLRAAILRELLKIYLKYDYDSFRKNRQKEKIMSIVENSANLLGISSTYSVLKEEVANNDYYKILKSYGLVDYSVELEDLFQNLLIQETSSEKEYLVDFGAAIILKKEGDTSSSVVSLLKKVNKEAKKENITRAYQNSIFYGIDERLRKLPPISEEHSIEDNFKIEIASALSLLGKIAFNKGNYDKTIQALEVLHSKGLLSSSDIIFLSMSYRLKESRNKSFQYVLDLIDEQISQYPTSELFLEKAIWLKRVGLYQKAANALQEYENQLRIEQQNKKDAININSLILDEKERLRKISEVSLENN